MHPCQRLVHPSKQFCNWFCGMAFRAAIVLLLMSSMSSKCLPFSISFIFGNIKKSLGTRSGEYAGCSNTVICLVAKTPSQTVRCIVMMQDPWVVGKKLGLFPSNFPVLPNSKLGWLSSWYKFIMNNHSNIKKVRNFVLTLDLDWQNFFGCGELTVFHCALCRFISGSC